MEEEFYLDSIPDGFEWGTLYFQLIFSVAMFNWDQERSSQKLNIDDDMLTVKVKDGSGFKTSLGDQVRLSELSAIPYLSVLVAFHGRREVLLPAETESGASGQDWGQSQRYPERVGRSNTNHQSES